jgi:hypothetical protein
MLIDPNTRLVWHEGGDGRISYTNIRPVCNLCGEEVDCVMEIKLTADGDTSHACFRAKYNCVATAMRILFSQYPEVDYLLTRMITYKPIPSTWDDVDLGKASRWSEFIWTVRGHLKRWFRPRK